MITLEKEFTARKFVHRQVKRAGDVALFERWHEDTPDRVHYEVVEIQLRKEAEVFGTKVPAHEAYPGAEQWGTYGFTYTPDDRAGAERKFSEMTA